MEEYWRRKGLSCSSWLLHGVTSWEWGYPVMLCPNQVHRMCGPWEASQPRPGNHLLVALLTWTSKPSASHHSQSLFIPVCPQTSRTLAYVPEGYFLLAEQPQTRSGQVKQHIFAIQLAVSIPFLMSSELQPWERARFKFVLNSLSPRAPYRGFFLNIW